MCDITDEEFEKIYLDKLIPSIKKILRIKYNLKIVKDNPMILKKFY